MWDSAFVVVAARSGRALSPDATAALRRPPPGLHFRPTEHLWWTDRAGTLAVGAWAAPVDDAVDDAADPSRPPWRVDPAGVVVAAGWGHLPGEPLVDVRTLLDRAHPPGRAGAPEAGSGAVIDGPCAVACLADGGDAVVTTDPFGARHLYRATTREAEVVGTRSTAVAHVAAHPGAPSKDPTIAAWLGWCRYPVGPTTGWRDVELLRPGAWFEVAAGAAPRVRTGRAPWERAEEAEPASTADLIERIRADIASVMCRVAERSDAVVDLTGGRDSRALTGAALGAGVARSLRFRTFGPPALADVQIAAELAAELGLEHEATLPRWHADRPTWGERATTFVDATAGATSVWDERRRPPGPPVVRVGGFPGEVMHSFWTPPTAPRSRDEILRFLRPRLVHGSLVRPEVEAALLSAVAADALAAPFDESPEVDAQRRLDRFSSANNHRYRFGPLLDLEGDLRVLPFLSSAVLDAAFALPDAARRTEIVHYALIAGASDALAAHRFAGPGWDAASLVALAAELGLPPPPVPAASGAAPGAAPPPAPRPGPKAGRKDESLVARFKRTATDDRHEAMADILGDRGNDVWAVADRDATLAALGRWGELSKLEQQEVYGVVTGALWLRR